MLHKPLFILAHQVSDRNFYPTYKRLIANQWQINPQQKKSQEMQLRKRVDLVWERALLPQIVPGTRDCTCGYKAGGESGEN